MKHDIELEYEYNVRIQNEVCIGRSDDFDVKVLKCEEITIKSEIEESSDDDIDQKDGDPVAFQAQDFSIVLTRFDSRENTKYQTKNEVGFEPHQSPYRKSSEVEKFKKKKTDNLSGNKSKPETHEPLNKQVGMFTCSQCDYKTKRNYDLKYHVLQHKSLSEVEVLRCGDCGYRTKNNLNLKRHKLRHKADAEVYKCSECEYKTVYIKTFRQHILIHRKSGVFCCSECGYQTNHKPNLQRHILGHKELSEVQIFSCGECNFQTRHKNSLEYHVLRHKSLSEVEVFRCGDCGYRTKNKFCLKRHKLRHKADAEVHECSKCEYKTVYISTFRQHMLTHRKSSGVFRCSECGYQTNHKPNLQRHNLGHKELSEGEMYSCKDCDYQTIHKGPFNKHKLRHKADAKVYTCDECQYKTVYIRTFRQHSFQHRKLSVEMFHCNECDYQTKHKRHLISHMVLHTAEIFSCGECDFQTKHKKSLKNHEQQHRDPSELEETSYHMYVSDIDNERNDCVDIKENFKVNLIECENATIKHEIDLEHEYKITIENKDCSKPGIENSSDSLPDNKDQKDRLPGDFQVKDFSIVSTSFDCRKNTNYHTKNKVGIEHHQSRSRKSSEVRMFNMDKTDNPSNKEVGMFTCSQCDYKTKQKYQLKSHNLRHKEMFSCNESLDQLHRDPSEQEETSLHVSECDAEIERINCVDIKEEFDVDLIECENATIKHDIESEYQYKVKTENENCFEPEIEDYSVSSPDNKSISPRNHKVGDHGASQVSQDLSIASTSFDCEDITQTLK